MAENLEFTIKSDVSGMAMDVNSILVEMVQEHRKASQEVALAHKLLFEKENKIKEQSEQIEKLKARLKKLKK